MTEVDRSQADPDRAKPPASRRRRRLLLAGLAVVVVAVSALVCAGPDAGRRLVEARISHQIAGTLHIGAIELSPLRGAVTLRDVALLAPPDPADAAHEEPVVLSVKRLDARLDLRRLLHREARIAELVLAEPVLDLDRVADGGVNLLRALAPRTPAVVAPPVPEGAEAKPAEGAPAAPPELGWRLALDHVRLEGGRVVFRDLVVAGSEALDVDVERFEVERLASSGDVYPEPTRVHLAARAEDAAVDVDAAVRVVASGWSVHARLDAQGLPLRRARFYLPAGSWSDVAGKIDGEVVTELAADGRARVYGEATIRDLVARVPELAEPALRIGKLRIEAREVDAAGRRASLTRATWEGGSLAVAPEGGKVLPALAFGEASPPKDTPPWSFTLAEAEVRGVTLHVVGAPHRPARDLTLDATLTGVSSAEGAPAGIELTLRDGGGRAEWKGTFVAEPLAARGAVKLASLGLPELLSLAPPDALRGLVVEHGSVSGALDVELGEDGLAARGAVRVADLRATTARKAPVVAAQTVDADVQTLHLPGLLASSDAAGVVPPGQLVLSRVTLESPTLALVRDADGFVGLDELAGAPPPPPQPASTPSGAGAFSLWAHRVEVTGGVVTIVDRTVSPFYQGRLGELALEADEMGWPWHGVRSLRGAAKWGDAPVSIEGQGNPKGTTFVVKGWTIPLRPLNPYFTAQGYSVREGDLTLVSSLWTGPEGFDAKSWLTLHQLDPGSPSGDTFREQFGVSLSVALALLTDLKGDISLDVPYWLDRKGFGIDVGEALRSALRQALTWALASPLKILGAILPGAGASRDLKPLEPIPFPVGAEALDASAAERLGALASTVAASPGLRPTLIGVVSDADERALREKALLAHLGGSGLLGRVRTLAEDPLDARLRRHLAGELPELTPAEREELERRLAAVDGVDDMLRELMAGRERAVRDRLVEGYGVKDVVLASTDPLAPVARGEASVRIVLLAPP